MPGFDRARRSWRSPVSIGAETMAAVVREALDALGFRYSRKKGERTFADVVSLDLNERGIPAWRFFVEHPAGFTLETYDTRERADFTLAFLEVHGYRDDDEPHVRRLLQRVAKDAPSNPWSFTFDQRMKIGPFHSAYREARRAWRPIQEDAPIEPGAA